MDGTSCARCGVQPALTARPEVHLELISNMHIHTCLSEFDICHIFKLSTLSMVSFAPEACHSAAFLCYIGL